MSPAPGVGGTVAGKSLGYPATGLTLLAAGAIVLIMVHTTGGVLVGCLLLGYGACHLITARRPAQRPIVAPPVPTPGLAEKIVLERQAERRTRERFWPQAG